MSLHDDMMLNEAGPVLAAHFEDVASVVYTSAAGVETEDIDAVLGEIRHEPIETESGVVIEAVRQVHIRKANLASVDTRGIFTIDSLSWGVRAKPAETPTWWIIEVVEIKRRELRSPKMRGV